MERSKIEQIIKSNYDCVMYITGGGTGAINNLLKFGGGSNFLLTARVPYCQNAFMFETTRTKDFVSLDACKDLCRVAIADCYKLNSDETKSGIGLACTAKLGYNGERLGREHKAYIGIRTKDTLNWSEGSVGDNYYFEFTPPENIVLPVHNSDGHRLDMTYNCDREMQENFLSEAILECLFSVIAGKPIEDKIKYTKLVENN